MKRVVEEIGEIQTYRKPIGDYQGKREICFKEDYF